jgi:hypothetical protein
VLDDPFRVAWDCGVGDSGPRGLKPTSIHGAPLQGADGERMPESESQHQAEYADEQSVRYPMLQTKSLHVETLDRLWYDRDMKTVRYISWQDDDMWLGYVEEYPDYMTQGETLEELQENLRDIYDDLTGSWIPGLVGG